MPTLTPSLARVPSTDITALAELDGELLIDIVGAGTITLVQHLGLQGGRTKRPGPKPIVRKRPTRLRSPNKARVLDYPTLRPGPDRVSTP